MKSHNTTFKKKRLALATWGALNAPLTGMTAVMMAAAMVSAPVVAQQAGGIKGKVLTEAGGTGAAGVTVTASSNVMPKPRTTTTNADGNFNLPLLIPGRYELTFTAADGTVRKATANVLLDQTSTVDLVMSAPGSDTEVIEIVGSAIVRSGNSSLTNSIGDDVVEGVPVGQNYRDLFKLVPGIQYSENETLGPSAGGSGVDNKYGFDGVDVSLPLFGNLASEPSTHDIEMVSMERGGAKAVGFNRSGGFAIDTKSKSGTNEFHGSLEYKLEDANFSASPDAGIDEEKDKSWITGSLSGPLIEDELFFYASYYRPEEDGQSKTTAYGEVKPFKSVRDEYFGKLTWAPTYELLLNLSYRTSEKELTSNNIGEFEADSVSEGGTTDQDILIFDGSWIIDDYTTLSFQYSEFAQEGATIPDNILSVVPSIGGSLDLANLDQMGYFNVPELSDDADFDNAGAQALIDQYGYVENGVRMGGGGVGAYSQFDNINFYRDSFELALDHEMYMGDTTHNLHFGFKWSEGEEELIRSSNGWGSISYIGGLEAASDDTPIYYRAYTYQVGFEGVETSVPAIVSSSESYNIEINDSIEHGDFTYNIGVLISEDIYYGQGLREKAGTVSGYEVAPGHKYKMYTVDWQDMIQPRLGVEWRYNGEDTVFANYAAYNPEASSIPRAASWDRNARPQMEVWFNEAGEYIEATPREGSSGKAFQEDMKPRQVEEFTIGTTKQLTNEWFLRAHARYREGSHFWEDVPNTARLSGTYGNGSVPAHIAEKGLYVENLADIRAEIGGSSYVIAEVDDGQTKYYELSLEAEWNGDRTYLNASYVWSHYYGNFDQDNTTATNDANTFIGSSWYNDGNGRYSWDNKYGTLSGDKPHILKVYGYYTTDWNANIGAYLLYQSGQPWEKWDPTYYGYAETVSATSRFGEPAGSRRSASHWQLDLNYTQDWVLNDTFTMKFRADLFNVFDRQTGYNIDPYFFDDTFGTPRSYYNPRRLQLSVGVEF
ncbi:TonB-dependent receptor [Bowmanella dokdonensis]|uniref:TonB-dependent receptor n=1 Tax=Bowmanella dokdonensis TaxID=751969 RepID=A0A939IT06_9ALTE|nr:TonB-dependent receptor [Bowmanella dokdonensis]MBN7827282.1 TonB-dependent receptor [Bowmanella dokdonensis]